MAPTVRSSTRSARARNCRSSARSQSRRRCTSTEEKPLGIASGKTSTPQNQSGPRMPEPIRGEACEEDAEADGAVDRRANDRARYDEPACDREDRGTDGMAWSAKGAASVPARPGRGSGHGHGPGNSRTKYEQRQSRQSEEHEVDGHDVAQDLFACG